MKPVKSNRCKTCWHYTDRKDVLEVLHLKQGGTWGCKLYNFVARPTDSAEEHWCGDWRREVKSDP